MAGTWGEDYDARFLVGEPLAGKTGPVQRVRDHDVVKVGRVFLPARRSFGFTRLIDASFYTPCLVFLQ